MPDLQTNPATASADASAGPVIPARDDAGGTDALAHLAKMSGTGSSFGAAEYVAISPLAVASLILALLGALSLLVSLLLFLPILGVVCGVAAIIKIRRSNNTQGGYIFALAGICIALLICGVVGSRVVQEQLTIREETNDVAKLVHDFGDQLSRGNYETAWDKYTSDDFKNRVNEKTFVQTFREIEQVPGYGRVESVDWNHENMIIDNVEGVETRVLCLTVMKFADMKEPGRELFRASNKDNGKWLISEIPRFFPPNQAKKAG